MILNILSILFKFFVMKIKSVFILLVVCLFTFIVSSCGSHTEAQRKQCQIKVGIVFDIGGKNDRSFNAAAWDGVKRAEKELPICLYDVEPGNPTSIEPAMRAFAEKNFDLIIGVGFAQGPIMQKVAEDYPNIKFGIVDGVITGKDGKPLPNVASLVFREHEGSYLVGMIAAAKSKTGKLGFVGGMDIPLIHKFATGYEEGAKSVNPNAQVIANYVGVTDSAWNNPGKGKELALSQIEKGVDVIFTAAGNSGLGAFDAVEQYGKNPQTGEANKFVIGVDSNQNGVKPGFVLTSMVKRVDNAVYDVVKEVLGGKFEGGFHVFGLDKDGVAYSLDEFNKDLISAETLQKVEEAKAKITSGEIKVTDAMAK
jgi:basic membrane protein A